MRPDHLAQGKPIYRHQEKGEGKSKQLNRGALNHFQ